MFVVVECYLFVCCGGHLFVVALGQAGKCVSVTDGHPRRWQARDRASEIFTYRALQGRHFGNMI